MAHPFADSRQPTDDAVQQRTADSGQLKVDPSLGDLQRSCELSRVIRAAAAGDKADAQSNREHIKIMNDLIFRNTLYISVAGSFQCVYF